MQLASAEYIPVIHEELQRYHTEFLANGSVRTFSRDTHPIPLLGIVELRLAGVPAIALPRSAGSRYEAVREAVEVGNLKLIRATGSRLSDAIFFTSRADDEEVDFVSIIVHLNIPSGAAQQQFYELLNGRRRIQFGGGYHAMDTFWLTRGDRETPKVKVGIPVSPYGYFSTLLVFTSMHCSVLRVVDPLVRRLEHKVEVRERLRMGPGERVASDIFEEKMLMLCTVRAVTALLVFRYYPTSVNGLSSWPQSVVRTYVTL